MKETKQEASESRSEDIVSLEKKVRQLKKQLNVVMVLLIVLAFSAVLALDFISQQFIKEFDEMYRVDTQLLRAVERLEQAE